MYTHAFKLASALALTALVAAPQPSCGGSAKKGETVVTHRGGQPTKINCGTINIDSHAGTLTTTNACVDAGSTSAGACTVTEMHIGTFIDEGQPGDGKLDCSELHNPQSPGAGGGASQVCVSSYSVTIPPQTGGGTPNGALVVCAKVQCPGDTQPHQYSAIAWSGSVRAEKDLCDCFNNASASGSGTIPDTLNLPASTTYDRGASFHIRTQTNGPLLTSCVVRSNATYNQFEISSHPGSDAAFAAVNVTSNGAVLTSQFVTLAAAPSDRPTGVMTTRSSLETMQMSVTLYNTAMVAIGTYNIQL